MHTLLVSPVLGFVWLTILFILCFLGVHVLRLARIGQSYRKQQKEQPSTPPPPTPKKVEEEKPEPVYYIVERKRRTKSALSEPKRIRFSQNDHNTQP